MIYINNQYIIFVVIFLKNLIALKLIEIIENK